MNHQLSAVKYVGYTLARRLLRHGVSTVEQLAAMPVEALAAVPGFGLRLAPLVLASARELLGSAKSEVGEVSAVAPEPVTVNAPVETGPAAEQASEKPMKNKQVKAAKKEKKAKKEKSKRAKKEKKENKNQTDKQGKKEKKGEEKKKKKKDKQQKKAKKSQDNEVLSF